MERWRVALAHLAAVLVVGVADYLSGPEYELRPFYLMPVVSAAWFGGRTVGVVVSIAAAAALFLANDYIGAALAKGFAIPIWNSFSRLTTYLVVVVLTAQLRTQANQLRAKTRALERESELREDYIALFVHELRHSAAAMALAAESLSSSPAIADDERAYLGHLRGQAADLERLASRLLAVGRSADASLSLAITDVDLNDLVSSTVARFPEARRLVARLAPRPARVRADPEQLTRSLDNFVRNALKYAADPTPVTVAVVGRDGQVGIEVTDAGIGFDPADAPKLFTKYGRLSNSRAEEGAGLGLYLSRLIVEAHGGAVEASSPGVGSGARFAFWLPAAPARA